jgi:hypothetical protein
MNACETKWEWGKAALSKMTPLEQIMQGFTAGVGVQRSGKHECEYSYTEFLCCDSAFAHKKEFYIFKFPERFLVIS